MAAKAYLRLQNIGHISCHRSVSFENRTSWPLLLRANDLREREHVIALSRTVCIRSLVGPIGTAAIPISREFSVVPLFDEMHIVILGETGCVTHLGVLLLVEPLHQVIDGYRNDRVAPAFGSKPEDQFLSE